MGNDNGKVLKKQKKKVREFHNPRNTSNFLPLKTQVEESFD